MTNPEKAINKMKHALGCDRLNAPDGIQECSRNFYALRGEDMIWKELVYEGYATTEVNFLGEHVYHVTDKGIKWLENVLGVILEVDPIGFGGENAAEMQG